MRLKVVTIYEPVSGYYFEWYCKMLKQKPELDSASEQLRLSGKSSFTSKDPTSNTWTTTTYSLEETPTPETED